MKPMIGITSSLKDEQQLMLSLDNIESITSAGGVPVVLPNLTEEEQVARAADHIDGLLVTGGGDIDPTLFGEEPHPALGSITPQRDEFEILIIRKLLEQNKPILALCRGCQILNIAAGGDMFQDIYAQSDRQLLQHSQHAPRSHASHFVEVKHGTLLKQITRLERFKVNSFHHQAVRHPAAGFVVSATSSDGVIEALESSRHTFVLGVQWHPECMTKRKDFPSRAIFTHFVEACIS
ncbi:putative glutamine amidotransferase [Evansella caseinilytica]|uniref:Putative glutamine amidotransferase n=1 Tax=Evansella caseinilytica TaxID=1503961 RepID=A0A1H3UH65_9BACI|nr:gamma-glutamyl-gamma-aminobutyrate hydrolase family protein [Evansella caseinilytica]SDZ61656.1 putative glutamine amidotransferase [Evansella caseinilytica]